MFGEQTERAQYISLRIMNHVGNEAKYDPSKTLRLLMGPEEVTKLKKTASYIIMMLLLMMMMTTMMLIIWILYPEGDGIVQIL